MAVFWPSAQRDIFELCHDVQSLSKPPPPVGRNAGEIMMKENGTEKGGRAGVTMDDGMMMWRSEVKDHIAERDRTNNRSP